MRPKFAVGFALLLCHFAIPVCAAETEDDSVFQTRVRLIERLQMGHLKQQVDAIEKKDTDGTDEATKRSSDEIEKHAQKETFHPHPLGVSGSAGQMFATFRMARGEERDFAVGERVPGWGTIKAIRQREITDEFGHVYRLAPPEGESQ